jgi:hypothetical protein
MPEATDRLGFFAAPTMSAVALFQLHFPLTLASPSGGRVKLTDI